MRPELFFLLQSFFLSYLYFNSLSFLSPIPKLSQTAFQRTTAFLCQSMPLCLAFLLPRFRVLFSARFSRPLRGGINTPHLIATITGKYMRSDAKFHLIFTFAVYLPVAVMLIVAVSMTENHKLHLLKI